MTNSEEIFLSISYNDIDNIVLATVLFSVVIFICYFATHKIRPSIRDTLMNKHVLVTGGSCGIGRSIALLAASNGANVTILARDKSRLASVKQEMISACNQQNNGEQILQDISLDVTGPYEAVEKAIRSAEEKAGPVHMLVTCAGTSICSRFEDTPMEQFERMVKLNLLGSVGPAKAVTRGMKARGDGYIVFTASLAAMFGIYGYSAYSASKFAIRGVAEALHMELKPYGVGVTVALPPDTDTPGFAEEEKGKLEETRLISQAGGLVSPDVVAEQILTDAIIGKFFSTVSFESLVVATSCVGMSPSYSSFELAWQLILMGPLRVVSACLLFYFNYLVETCMKKRDKRKRSE